jgi:hypothetical protein
MSMSMSKEVTEPAFDAAGAVVLAIAAAAACGERDKPRSEESRR